VSHVIDPSPTSASHVGDVKLATTSHAGDIYSVEKPRWIGCKPKFSCKLCKGDHLEMWSYLFISIVLITLVLQS
jgi:hypothetical protein